MGSEDLLVGRKRTVPRRTGGERRDLRQKIKLQRQIKSMSKILQNQSRCLGDGRGTGPGNISDT
jgi:hypothetical protein